MYASSTREGEKETAVTDTRAERHEGERGMKESLKESQHQTLGGDKERTPTGMSQHCREGRNRMPAPPLLSTRPSAAGRAPVEPAVRVRRRV